MPRPRPLRPAGRRTGAAEMAGLERLNAALAKLRGAEAAAERTVPGGVDGIVEVLLTEISETILPREMTIGDGAGQEIRLLAARRRLLRVGRTGPVTADAAPIPAEPPEATGDPAEPLIAAFHGRVRPFVAKAAELSVAASRPPYRVDPTEAGCSVEALRAAADRGWTAPAASAPAPEPLPDQAGETATPPPDPVGTCLARATAGLRLREGQIVAMQGDAEFAHRLTGFTGLGLGAMTKAAGDGPGTTCAILRAPAPSNLLLVRVAHGRDAALFLSPSEELPAILALCRATGPAARSAPLDRAGSPD